MRNNFWGSVIVCAILTGNHLALADDPPAKVESEATVATPAESTTVIVSGDQEVKAAGGPMGSP